MLQEYLALQIRQLSEVGYPEPLVLPVAESMLQKMKYTVFMVYEV